jgi:uncharacterized integral membrane protein (TIGR00698 family)
MTLLVAAGYSICGVSAIAAVNGSIEADEDHVAVSVALVTLFGTFAMVVLPAAGLALGLENHDLGSWIGASTHDVGQVVAAGSTVGAVAASTAMIVKLTRVALLAPLVAVVAWRHRRHASTGENRQRPPLVPLFVAGFLGTMLIRSTGFLDDRALDAIGHVERGLLVSAMFALGAGVDLRRIRSLGHRPLLLGAIAWTVVAGVSLGTTLAW